MVPGPVVGPDVLQERRPDDPRPDAERDQEPGDPLRTCTIGSSYRRPAGGPAPAIPGTSPASALAWTPCAGRVPTSAAIRVACWLSRRPAGAGAVSVPPAAPQPTSPASRPTRPTRTRRPAASARTASRSAARRCRAADWSCRPARRAPPASIDAAAWTLVDLDSGRRAGRRATCTAATSRPASSNCSPRSRCCRRCPAQLRRSPSAPPRRTPRVRRRAARRRQVHVDNLFSGLLLVSGNDAADGPGRGQRRGRPDGRAR